MVSALIMPRSATMQASWIPKRSRSRLTTGNNNVTSAVLPGIRKEGDRPVGIIEHDAEHDLLQVPAVVFGMAALAQASPPAPSNHKLVVSKNAIETAPNSGWRWR